MRLIEKVSILVKGMKYFNMLLSFIYFFLFTEITYGQDIPKNISFKKNSLTAEIFGHSRSLLSSNYERLFKLSPNYLFYTVRTGVGYTPGVNIRLERHKGVFAIPLVFSLLAGKEKHFAQLSLGYAASFGEDFIDSTTTTPTIYQRFESAYSLSIGYRYMWNSFIVQIFPLLQWTNNISNKFSAGFGLSMGLAF